LSGRKKNIFTIPSENTKGGGRGGGERGGRAGEAIMDRRFKVMMQKPSVYRMPWKSNVTQEENCGRRRRRRRRGSRW
jgi:hypothetical protein